MKKRVVWTVVVLALFFICLTIYGELRGPIEGSAAVGQLSDSAVEYGFWRSIARGSIPGILGIITLVLLVLIWLPSAVRKVRKGLQLILLLGCCLVALTACGPPQLEVVEEIGPSETAFLVPLEGATKADQAKFMSIDYLEKAKVATKRVTIPTRKIDTGRGPGAHKWLPTMKLIKVDRAPITREWTKSSDTGTSTKNQAISVESKESIDFYLGVTAQASIKEDDASKFLYNFAGKTLDEVMDTNVRGLVQSALWKEFGSRTLTDGKATKREIIDAVHKETREFFAKQGLTIDYIGGAEGLTYKDVKVQDAINKAFLAENDKKVAQEEQAAQQTRNQTKIQIAEADRKAAEEFAKAKEAQTARIELDIKMLLAEAKMQAAKKWDGKLPEKILPQGSSMLFLEESVVPTVKK